MKREATLLAKIIDLHPKLILYLYLYIHFTIITLYKFFKFPCYHILFINNDEREDLLAICLICFQKKKKQK